MRIPAAPRVIASLLCGVLLAAPLAAADSPQTSDAVTAAETLKQTDSAGALRLIDELLRRPRVPGDGAVRAHALLRKCWWSDDTAVAMSAANEGMAEAARAGDAKRTAELFSCRGNALENSGQLDAAARDYTDALTGAERTGVRDLEADALVQRGFLRYFRGDFNEALVDLQKAYELNGVLGRDDGRRLSLAYIAHIYADARVGQYDRAIEYYRQLLPQYEAARSKTSVADTLFNIGSTYERKGDFPSALDWYRQSLAAEQKLGRASEGAFVKRSIGVTLVKLGRPAEGLPWLDEALRYFIATKDIERTAVARQSRGIAYRNLGRIKDAIADLETSRAYFESTKNSRFLEKSQEELALAYAAAGRWQDAFAARSAQMTQDRELADKMREEHTTRLRIQFDVEKKDQENRALLRENALRAKALEAGARVQRLQTIVLILGGIIIVALVYLVIRHVRDERRMRLMAMTDELTRLPNRRHLLSVAEEQMHRSRATGAPFSLVALDIDLFKRINDTWGHGAGDRVLQQVAHACRLALRPNDLIGRTGGEEFTVVLPSATRDVAWDIAERLRKAVEEIDFRDIDSSLHVTISLGVAEWTAADTTLVRLAGRADEVLYRAKETGRNRVELATA